MMLAPLPPLSPFAYSVCTSVGFDCDLALDILCLLVLTSHIHMTCTGPVAVGSSARLCCHTQVFEQAAH